MEIEGHEKGEEKSSKNIDLNFIRSVIINNYNFTFSAHYAKVHISFF